MAAFFSLAALASDAQMCFSSDKNGQNRVTSIQEGDEIWIVVIDNDQNIDCDIRDKMGPDLKIMDPKTGAYIIWNPDADDDWLDEDFLEETGADTGVFVSNRSFQVGTRYSYAAANEHLFTHVVDVPAAAGGGLDDFQWGHYMYIDGPDANPHADNRGWFGAAGGVGPDPGFTVGLFNPPLVGGLRGVAWGPDVDAPNLDGADDYLIGRFENMDTLIGMYQDPNDATDVATAMMKIIDVEATISWDMEVYKDANTSATITVVDPDENLNCNEIEYVPVFILVNPGSWNPVQTGSPTNFCMLLRTGGVVGVLPANAGNNAAIGDEPVRWYNIYQSDANSIAPDGAGADDGRYYIEYPVQGDGNVTFFDTEQVGGITGVSFYAQETGSDTGVFQLNLNQILDDLDFDQLFVRDVLVAYYLDPNDFDDFKLATAYIEERQHSVTSFTDANRADQELFWIGRDPVYVQVIDANANVDPCCPEQVVVHICDPHGEDDAEWIVLDETSSNSPVFFSFAGYQLWPVWDALGVGLADSIGGWLMQLDNWKVEVFNEDDVYARYNDVYYTQAAMNGLGDVNVNTAFPPQIDRIRVGNDVSFDLMSIGDTQVYDGTTTNMYFLDRQGNRVSGYVNSDCVFVEVVDPDQDEDQYRRERIDGFWDGAQNIPFGPIAHDVWGNCGPPGNGHHDVNDLLGHTVIFGDQGWAKLYVLNPRNGFWAAVDLLETGVATGNFVSVICIDLVKVYECAPSLRVLPGDTIVAFYQDPTNHSDSAMVSIKVGIGGGGTPPTQQSTAMFVDADGNDVANYTDADLVYVKAIDPSHTGAALLANAIEIDGETYDLTLVADDVFMTAGLDLGLAAGASITATYTDPTDPTDTSSDTITVIASVLEVVEFFAGPSPFEGDCTFGYVGTGTASVMTVEVYDLAGALVWAEELADVTEIVWDGTDETGTLLANGAYIYKIYATDGTNSFADNGKVFVSR